ncbi:putative iron-sulfur cluster binding protein [Chondrocystis sp. NIES-4102]|nr:putative iron-sulfur cluster binding protein [Chondrocystis sp. NIES-4102]
MIEKVVLFDFDGTIADTYQALANITNQLSGEFGYKALEPEELLLLKNLSSREIVKRSEISLFKLPFLVRRVRAELSKEIAELITIPGIAQVLIELKNRGYILGIVTSNVKENVEVFLAKHQLNNLFTFIYSSTAIFGKHRVINRVIKDNHLNKSDVIYVGDETRDIRSARKSEVGIIGVTWGFNSATILQLHQPDYLIDQPHELLEAVNSYYLPNKKTVIQST